MLKTNINFFFKVMKGSINKKKEENFAWDFKYIFESTFRTFISVEIQYIT